jgi:hypothetical protein
MGRQYTSGASHLGLLASKDVIEEPALEVCTMRLRLKSVTLTLQWRSTSMLGDFRSRCRMVGLCECKCSTPCTMTLVSAIPNTHTGSCA